MFFKQLATKESSLSYFFGCAGHAIAAAVDVVAGDEDGFIEKAAQANVRIVYVIDTHVHADHFSGGRELAKRVGAPYCLHESARSFVKFDCEPLVDGLTWSMTQTHPRLSPEIQIFINWNYYETSIENCAGHGLRHSCNRSRRVGRQSVRH